MVTVMRDSALEWVRGLRRKSAPGSAARVIGLVAGLVLAIGLAGCSVRVEKGANGKDKNVQVDVPFGGVHVNTDVTTAADLGLPVYPGAQLVSDNDKEKSADVHLGFGDWELRVRAVNYATSDSQAKVTDFYKKALSRYGDVIACQGNVPVGTPAVTTEGLTCSDGGKSGDVKADSGGYRTGHSGFELKAGSKRYQHIVGFESSQPGQTHFVLVELELPASDESGKSD